MPMKEIIELPQDVITYIQSFLDHSNPAHFLLSSKIIRNKNHSFFTTESEKSLIKYGLKIFNFIENCYYSSTCMDDGLFSVEGNRLFRDWLKTDSGRCSFEEIINLLVRNHGIDFDTEEEKNEYIHEKLFDPVKPEFFKLISQIFLELCFKENFLSPDIFEMGSVFEYCNYNETKKLSKTLFLIQQLPENPAIQRQIDDLKEESTPVHYYLEIQKKFPSNILNMQTGLSEADLLTHVQDKFNQYPLLKLIFDNLFLSADNFYFFQSILKNQPALINLTLLPYSISLVHLAVETQNIQILDYLIESGADINKEHIEPISDLRTCTPLLLAVQILIYIEELPSLDSAKNSLFSKIEKIILKLLEYGANIHLYGWADSNYWPSRYHENLSLLSTLEFCDLILAEDHHRPAVVALLTKVVSSDYVYCSIL